MADWRKAAGTTDAESGNGKNKEEESQDSGESCSMIRDGAGMASSGSLSHEKSGACSVRRRVRLRLTARVKKKKKKKG